MTIATVIEASDKGIAIHSCPAKHLVGFGGSLTMWPRSVKPIRIPYAWVYSLSFSDLAGPDTPSPETAEVRCPDCGQLLGGFHVCSEATE